MLEVEQLDSKFNVGRVSIPVSSNLRVKPHWRFVIQRSSLSVDGYICTRVRERVCVCVRACVCVCVCLCVCVMQLILLQAGFIADDLTSIYNFLRKRKNPALSHRRVPTSVKMTEDGPEYRYPDYTNRGFRQFLNYLQPQLWYIFRPKNLNRNLGRKSVSLYIYIYIYNVTGRKLNHG